MTVQIRYCHGPNFRFPVDLNNTSYYKQLYRGPWQVLAILSSWPLLTAAFLKIQIPITSNSASVFSVHVMKADTCQLMPFFPNHSDCVSRNLFGSHFMAQSMTTRYWCFSRLLRILDLALSRLMALSTCAVYWSTRSEDCSMWNSRSFFCPWYLGAKLHKQ